MTGAQVRIKSSRTPYKRGGVDFNSTSWTELDAAAVSREQVGKLLADGNLTIQVREGEGEWRTLSAEERGLGAPPALGRADDAGESEDLQDEIDLLRDKLTSADDRIADLTALNGTLKSEMAARDGTIADLEEKLSIQAGDLAARDLSIKDLQRQVEKLTEDLAAAIDGSGSTDTSSQTAGRDGDAAGASASAAEPSASGDSSSGGQKAEDAPKAAGKGKGGRQAQS